MKTSEHKDGCQIRYCLVDRRCIIEKKNVLRIKLMKKKGKTSERLRGNCAEHAHEGLICQKKHEQIDLGKQS